MHIQTVWKVWERCLLESGLNGSKMNVAGCNISKFDLVWGETLSTVTENKVLIIRRRPLLGVSSKIFMVNHRRI